jgi:hypothetical protein
LPVRADNNKNPQPDLNGPAGARTHTRGHKSCYRVLRSTGRRRCATESQSDGACVPLSLGR